MAELVLILLLFFNMYSNTISRLSCYVDTNTCTTVLDTNYYSAFSYNTENCVYLVIITTVILGISSTTLISSLFLKIKNIILFHMLYHLLQYVYLFQCLL